MKYVQTVLGKKPINEIGKTDAHDHLIRIGGVEVICNGTDFDMPDEEKAIQELELFKTVGGNTLVEMSPIGSGRHIESLVKVSQKSRVNIIDVTGFHKSELYDKSHFLYKYSTEEIASLLIADLEEGIDKYDYAGPIVKRTSSKAGVIKAAGSYQSLTDIEKKELKAAAIASVKTGFPISMHLEKGTMALEVVDILLENGVQADNIMLGHIDRNPDFYYHKKLAQQGIYLIYDGAARVKYYTDEVIENLYLQMIDAGFEDQLMNGADLGGKSYFRAYEGGPGLGYNFGTFLPRLAENGLSQEIIDKITTLNPRQAFSNKKYEM